MALEPIVQRHKQLLTDISDNMVISSKPYDDFVEHMKVYVPSDLLNSKKTLLGKFDLLATKGYLMPGRYDVLKTIADKIGNNDIMELIEQAEKDIKAFGNAGTERNKSQLTEAGPPTSRPTPNIENDGLDHLHISDSEHRDYYDNYGKKGDSEHRDYYDNHGKKGLLLILNSEEKRKGTKKDVEKITDFYGENGVGFDIYDVKEYKEKYLTKTEVELCLKDVRNFLNKHGKRYYCFVCVILSHGNENGIQTRDGLKSIEEIRSLFNNQNMPNFAGKPKVFFIQESLTAHAIDYRDDEKGTETERNEVEDEADEIIHVPTDADTLFAKGYRREDVGSWFITECMDVFKEFYKTDHLEDMLITVRENVALKWRTSDGRKQMPFVWSTLTKRLMLT